MIKTIAAVSCLGRVVYDATKKTMLNTDEDDLNAEMKKHLHEQKTHEKLPFPLTLDELSREISFRLNKNPQKNNFVQGTIIIASNLRATINMYFEKNGQWSCKSYVTKNIILSEENKKKLEAAPPLEISYNQ